MKREEKSIPPAPRYRHRYSVRRQRRWIRSPNQNSQTDSCARARLALTHQCTAKN